MDTEMSMTDIANGCAISKWQINTAMSTSKMGNGSCCSNIKFDFFFRSTADLENIVPVFTVPVFWFGY